MSFLLLLLLSIALSRIAWAESVRVDTVEVELIADRDAVVAGQRLRVGLFVRHDPEWHTYWRNPGDSGLPTQFPLSMPAGFEAGDIRWPWPTRVLIPPLANFGFENDVLLMRDVRVPDRVDADSVRFTTLAQWLVCREVCVPGEAELSLTLPVADTAAPSPSAVLFAAAERRLPAAAAPVDASIDGGSLRLRIPAAMAGADTERIEYFSYTEGTTVAAADQRMTPLADGGWRLEVELAGGDTRLADGRGVLVIDDRRAVEIVPQAVEGAAVAPAGAGETRLVKGHLAPFMAARADPASSLLAAAGSARPADRAAGLAQAARPALGAVAPAAAAASGAGAATSLWVAIGLAAIGGLILNLMPCVFPVIGLKILGFAGHGGLGPDGRLLPHRRRAVRSGAVWFAAGVVVSFWLLVGLLLTLRGLGESIGWGFQLQSPVFVSAMALLFLVIGLNFSGLFEFGAAATRLGNVGANAPDGGGPLGAFAAGVLAVLVATPCTAPFMGSAIGFTLSQPAASTVAVFTALGVGMALPYLLLGAFPGWLRWLPRPGRWMETLKQFLAFPMYAAAAWLAWVLARQRDGDAVLALMLGAIVIACGLWLWGRQVQGARPGGRGIYGVLAVLLLAAGGWLAWPAGEPERVAGAGVTERRWQPWSNDAVRRALADGRPVLIDFTAAWCVTCQVNKKLVLESTDVEQALRARGTVMLVADWTDRNPAITAELARHGRNSVPLYLLYRPSQAEPIVLPELLTKGVVLEAVAGSPIRD